MRIKVYHRNPRAAEAFQLAKLHHKALVRGLPAATKRPEPPSWKGFLAEDMEAANVEYIQTQVVERLHDHLIGDGYVLAKGNIWVFERQEQCDDESSLESVDVGHNLKRVVDGDEIHEGATYYAFEVFDIIPCDLYKNVPFSITTPATFCRPERRNKTKLAPLALASLSPWESSFPWTQAGVDGQPMVHGIPLSSKKVERLFCGDESLPITDSKWNPTVTATQRMGVEYAMSLERYETLVNSVEQHEDFFAQDPTAGILKELNPLTRDKKEGSGFERLPAGYDVERQQLLSRYSWSDTTRTVFEGVEDASSPLSLLLGKEEALLKIILSYCVPHQSKKVRQELLFNFLLRRGTNLRRHCMALVVDNSSSDKDKPCSLVRTNGEELEPWDRNLVLPRGSWTCNENYREVINDDEALERHLSPTKPAVLHALCYDNCYAFPLVAAAFQLSQIVVKGWAEPTPPQGLDVSEVEDDSESDYESDTDSPQEKSHSNGDKPKNEIILYKAMRALFHQVGDKFIDRDDTFRAIQNLESEDYHAAAIEKRQRELLVAIMYEERYQYHNGEPYGYELERAFYPAIEILEEVDGDDEEEE